MQVLVTGCGRSGTLYMTNVLQAMGLNVGHETDGPDGTVDWHAAAWPEERTAHYDVKLHLVRHPLDVFASLKDIKSTSWRYIESFAGHAPGLGGWARCMSHWLRWNLMAEDVCGTDDVYQVEEIARQRNLEDLFLTLYPPELDAAVFTSALVGRVQEVSSRTHTRANGKSYHRPTWEELGQADPILAGKVRFLAESYGYVN